MVVGDLEADAAAAAAHGTEQLAHQAFTLLGADAADDGEPRMERQGEGERPMLED